MLKAAAQNGWLDWDRVIISLLALAEQAQTAFDSMLPLKSPRSVKKERSVFVQARLTPLPVLVYSKGG